MNRPIAIHRATLEDSRDIWSWRNDTQTRAMSITTAEVSWDTHTIWFRDLLQDRNRYLYVGYLAEEVKKMSSDI